DGDEGAGELLEDLRGVRRAVGEHPRLGRVELQAAAELGDLAGEQAPASGDELLRAPRLVEVGEGEGAAGLVGDDDLEVAAAALAGPGTHGLPHGGADLGEDRHLLADPERAEVGLL